LILQSDCQEGKSKEYQQAAGNINILSGFYMLKFAQGSGGGLAPAVLRDTSGRGALNRVPQPSATLDRLIDRRAPVRRRCHKSGAPPRRFAEAGESYREVAQSASSGPSSAQPQSLT
jgi:hypothetical protein